MYHLLTSMPIRRLLVEQIPALAISLGVAEVFYKFHSFLAESIAFLITWLVVDATLELSRRALPRVTARPALNERPGA